MALPAGRYGVTKNQLLKIKKLPMNTIKLIEELTEKFDLLGTAAFKNSTSVVTESSDLVESGAVKDIVGWGNANNLPPVIWHLNNYSSFDGTDGDTNPTRTRTTPAFAFPFPSQTFEISGLPSCITALNGVKCFDSAKTEIGMAQVNDYKFTTLANTAYVYILLNGENITVADMANAQIMVCREGKTPSSYEPYHASVEDTLRDAEVVEGNLLTLTNFTDNKLVLVDGSLSDNAGWMLTDYIAIGSEKSTVLNLDGSGNLPAIAFYNSSKQFISGIQYSQKLSLKFVTPLNTAYCRVSLTKPYQNAELYVIPLKDVVPNKCDNTVIAPVENGSTASQAYAVNDVFIRNGALCKVTSAISQGDTLSNQFTVTNVGAILTALLNA